LYSQILAEFPVTIL